MHKLTKKLTPLLLILSIAIMTGCKTNTTTDLVLPPEPKRQTVNIPETVKDYAALIIYYEGLVREWELWAETTKTLLETETSTP